MKPLAPTHKGWPGRAQGHAESGSDHRELTFSTYVPGYMDSVNLTMMNHTTNSEGPAAPPPLPPARHRRLRRVIIAAIALMTVALLAAGAGFGYLHWRLSQFKRIDVAASVLDRPGTSSTGNRGTYNTLLIGTDSRADVSGAEASGSVMPLEDRRGCADEVMVDRPAASDHQACGVSKEGPAVRLPVIAVSLVAIVLATSCSKGPVSSTAPTTPVPQGAAR